jgi:outer membrane receptor for ferrienterochelin and colicins
VITLQSKDPRQFPGTTVEVTGGNRSYRNVQARHASVFGDWGIKVSGEYQGANDWDNVLTYNIAGVPNRGTVAVRENEIPDPIDWNAQVIRGTGSLVRYMGASRFEVSAGASETDGVGQTNVGRNQLRDWQYNFAQARLTTPRFYFNAYRTQSTSGESFAVNRYADAWARNPTLTADSLRMLSDWPSDGRMYAADAQHNFTVPMLLNTRIVWGGGYRRDVVSSQRQWLTDRLTGQDIEIDQRGVFAQTETPLLPQLNLVLAGRYDAHENYDAQFSPKAGLVFKPAPDHAVRVTYNRAFKSPTTLQTNFHIPDWTAVVAIYGNTQGFTARNASGAVLTSYEPLQPEQNETVELGYKGVLGSRLFVDGVYYRSNYEHFLSPLVIIANPYTASPTFAHDAAGGRILNPAGLAPVTLTYINLGQAELQGADIGLNLYATRRLRLNGTFSWLDLRSAEVPAGREEATSLNSPGTKWTLGGTMTELPVARGLAHVGASTRYVNRYYFRSGINMGQMPTFTTLDVNAGYRLPGRDMTVNLGVQNLFGCSQSEDNPFAYAPTDAVRMKPTNFDRTCGFGQKHTEMINMPAVGTMVFLGVRVHR